MSAVTLEGCSTSFKCGELTPDAGFLLRFDQPLSEEDWGTALSALDDFFLTLLDDREWGEVRPDVMFVAREDLLLLDAPDRELASIAGAVGAELGQECDAYRITSVQNGSVGAVICCA